MLIFLGAGIAGFSLSKHLPLSLYDAGAGGRFDDGGVRHRDVAGAVDYDKRNARPRDERLQLRLPRRDADGESGVRMAGPMPTRAPLVLAVNGLVLVLVALYFLMVQRRVAAL